MASCEAGATGAATNSAVNRDVAIIVMQPPDQAGILAKKKPTRTGWVFKNALQAQLTEKLSSFTGSVPVKLRLYAPQFASARSATNTKYEPALNPVGRVPLAVPLALAALLSITQDVLEEHGEPITASSGVKDDPTLVSEKVTLL